MGASMLSLTVWLAVLCVLHNAVTTTAAPPVDAYSRPPPVQMNLGSSSTSDVCQIVFDTPPQAFALTNFRDGTLTLTYMGNKYLMAVGYQDMGPIVMDKETVAANNSTAGMMNMTQANNFRFQESRVEKRLRRHPRRPALEDADAPVDPILLQQQEKATAAAEPGAARVLRSFIRVDDFTVNGIVKSDAVNMVVADLPQWSLVFRDGFERDAVGYSVDARQVCGGSGDVFLGGYCKVSSQQIIKTFSPLPRHSFVRVKARFHFFDKWQHNVAYLRVDGSDVWTESHHYCPKVFGLQCRGINVCGDEVYPDRLSTQIDVTIPHSGPTVKVVFGSDLPPESCQASYGIDDVEIHTL